MMTFIFKNWCLKLMIIYPSHFQVQRLIFGWLFLFHHLKSQLLTKLFTFVHFYLCIFQFLKFFKIHLASPSSSVYYAHYFYFKLFALLTSINLEETPRSYLANPAFESKSQANQSYLANDFLSQYPQHIKSIAKLHQYLRDDEALKSIKSKLQCDWYHKWSLSSLLLTKFHHKEEYFLMLNILSSIFLVHLLLNLNETSFYVHSPLVFR